VLPVEWRDNAREDLRAIITFIAEQNPDAAERLNAVIEHATERLSQFPYMYRSGRAPDTREAVVHPNYIVIYRVGASHIDILGVVHSRQQYPPS
jgi:toxin ParE1/3/4